MPVGFPETENVAQCLDVVQVTWSENHDREVFDDAIVLEVSRTGGLLHAGLRMPKNLDFRIDVGSRKVAARVDSCVYDGYGFVVRFTVRSREWFPSVYQPAILKFSRDVSQVARRRKPSHAA
jgi:hypothetical protein